MNKAWLWIAVLCSGLQTLYNRPNLNMDLSPKVQLDLMPSAEELQVRGINLAGEEVAHLHLGKEDWASRSCSSTRAWVIFAQSISNHKNI